MGEKNHSLIQIIINSIKIACFSWNAAVLPYYFIKYSPTTWLCRMQVEVLLFWALELSACSKKYPFVHSFTQLECLNIGIHEYLGKSLNISENSQLSHFFNIFFSQLVPKVITKNDHKSAVCLGKRQTWKPCNFLQKFCHYLKCGLDRKTMEKRPWHLTHLNMHFYVHSILVILTGKTQRGR